jgi:hypothetical protein
MNPAIITNGKENPTSGESVVQIMCWHEGREKYLADVIGKKTPHGDFMKVTDPIFEPALAGYKQEIAGRWVTQTFLIPNETILVLYANKRRHWQDGGRPARLIIRMRDRAALRQVEFETLRLSASTKGTVDVIRGRFDVLSAEEAKKIGFVVNPLHNDHYSQANQVAQFSTRILEGELQAAAETEIVQSGTSHGSQGVVIRKRTRDL